MKRKRNYKTIQNNPNMGLHDSVCKNKVGYCTKKNVFLNGQQISIKMCGVKNYDEKNNTYSPCPYFIDKNKKPKKFEEKVKKAIDLHAHGEKVTKKHEKIVETKDENGEIIERKIPICQTIHLNDKYRQVADKTTCKCMYSEQLMGEELCKKRGCKKGTFGKWEGESCPHLLEISNKKQKQKKKKKKDVSPEVGNNVKVVYQDKEQLQQKQVAEDEIVLFGQVYKKDMFRKDGENNEETKNNS